MKKIKEKRDVFTVRSPREVYKKLEKYIEKTGMIRNTFVVGAIKEKLARTGR